MIFCTLLDARHYFCLNPAFPRPTPRPSQTTSSRPRTTKTTETTIDRHTIQINKTTPHAASQYQRPVGRRLVCLGTRSWFHLLPLFFSSLSVFFSVSDHRPPAGRTLISAVHISRDKNKSEKRNTRAVCNARVALTRPADALQAFGLSTVVGPTSFDIVWHSHLIVCTTVVCLYLLLHSLLPTSAFLRRLLSYTAVRPSRVSVEAAAFC